MPLAAPTRRRSATSRHRLPAVTRKPTAQVGRSTGGSPSPCRLRDGTAGLAALGPVLVTPRTLCREPQRLGRLMARASPPGHHVTRTTPGWPAYGTGRASTAPTALAVKSLRRGRPRSRRHLWLRSDMDRLGPAGPGRRSDCHLTTPQVSVTRQPRDSDRPGPVARCFSGHAHSSPVMALGPAAQRTSLPERVWTGKSLPPNGRRRRMPDLVAPHGPAG